MFGLRQGKIEFVGTGPIMKTTSVIEDDVNGNDNTPNYSNFIVEKGHENCLPLFFEYLQNLKEKWICAELCDIPENQIVLSHLNQTSKNIKPVLKCLHTALPSSNEALLRNIKRKDRKEMERYLRRIKKSGFETELIDCSKKHSMSNGMNELFEINQKRWNAKGLPGAFPDPRLRNFYLDIADSFSQNGWLGLYCLKLSGKTVSALYGFKYNNKYYAYKTGMDPAYSRFNIGNLLFLNVMEMCIQEGMVEFDFMWGIEPYKIQFNTRERSYYKAIIPKKSPLGAFNYSLYSEYWHEGERLKYFYQKLHNRCQ